MKQSLLAVIPARGGSKGIPRKNIKPLAGKPLIAWTIEAAKKAASIDRIIVSSEDEEIASVAKQFDADVPFLRPAKLAQDDTPGFSTALHAIEQLPDYDWLLLLQPTSPFRTAEDIDGIWRFCQSLEAPSAVSICEADKHPYWMYQRNGDQQIHPLIKNRPDITCRQDLPQVFALNGALYLAKTDWLLKQGGFVGQETVGYVMPKIRSVDLDTPLDWEWAEHLTKGRLAEY